MVCLENYKMDAKQAPIKKNDSVIDKKNCFGNRLPLSPNIFIDANKYVQKCNFKMRRICDKMSKTNSSEERRTDWIRETK